MEKELAAAKNDLDACRESLKNKRFDWASTQAYYSCFHAARALLFHKGFREKGHYCLAVAVKQLYSSDLPISVSIILEELRSLREEANYEVTIIVTKTAAENALEDAEKFVETAASLLKKKK